MEINIAYVSLALIGLWGLFSFIKWLNKTETIGHEEEEPKEYEYDDFTVDAKVDGLVKLCSTLVSGDVVEHYEYLSGGFTTCDTNVGDGWGYDYYDLEDKAHTVAMQLEKQTRVEQRNVLVSRELEKDCVISVTVKHQREKKDGEKSIRS